MKKKDLYRMLRGQLVILVTLVALLLLVHWVVTILRTSPIQHW